MREIKFRAWIKDLKKMVDVTELNWSRSDRGELLDAVFWHEGNRTVRFFERAISELEVMQFTGLKDKNGKEIYEGDVVKFQTKACNPNLEIITKFETIKIESINEFFENKGYAEGELGYNYNAKYLEVIGNIYENPELLKVKE